MAEYIMLKEFANAPVTVQELVRCKDCIYSKPYNSVWVKPKQPNLLWCIMLDDIREKTWFCADGKMKGEE